jgi:hypothetical protein
VTNTHPAAPNQRTRPEWVRYIKESWAEACRSSIGGFIETGRRLIACKDELEHGEWLKMIGSVSFCHAK